MGVAPDPFMLDGHDGAHRREPELLGLVPVAPTLQACMALSGDQDRTTPPGSTRTVRSPSSSFGPRTPTPIKIADDTASADPTPIIHVALLVVSSIAISTPPPAARPAPAIIPPTPVHSIQGRL